MTQSQGITSVAFDRVAVALALLALGLFAQGCLAFPYTTTPPVSGVAIDKTTCQPIQGAKVGFRDNRKATQTKADGTFSLRANHRWGFAFILPFEFTPCGGTFFIEAPGYLPFERDLGYQVYRPILFQEPVALTTLANHDPGKHQTSP